jgi:hypothetical protein
MAKLKFFIVFLPVVLMGHRPTPSLQYQRRKATNGVGRYGAARHDEASQAAAPAWVELF